MEALFVSLAGQTIQLLTPYIKKGFDKFSEELGNSAAEKVKGLFNTIKNKFSNDPKATNTMAQYQKEPETHEVEIKNVLMEKLAQDKDLVTELNNRLKELKPVLEIIQKGKWISTTGEVTALKADKMGAKRDIHVTQEFEVVDGKLTGPDVKEIDWARYICNLLAKLIDTFLLSAQ
jgi:hypothetical protein